MRDDPGRRRRQFLAAVAGVGAAAVAGCSGESTDGSGTATDSDGTLLGYDVTVSHSMESWDGYDTDWESPATAPDPSLRRETLVENLEIPWDLSFAADGTLFLTERVGRIRRFEDGELQTVAQPEDAIDAGAVDPESADEDGWWVDGGEGGTLGVATHPQFPDPPVLYAYYTYEDGDGERYNRVAAYDVAADAPERTETTVVDAIPGTNIHNGGRLTFGPANYLWITTGDAGEGDLSADLE